MGFRLSRKGLLAPTLKFLKAGDKPKSKTTLRPLDCEISFSAAYKNPAWQPRFGVLPAKILVALRRSFWFPYRIGPLWIIVPAGASPRPQRPARRASR